MLFWSLLIDLNCLPKDCNYCDLDKLHFAIGCFYIFGPQIVYARLLDLNILLQKTLHNLIFAVIDFLNSCQVLLLMHVVGINSFTSMVSLPAELIKSASEFRAKVEKLKTSRVEEIEHGKSESMCLQNGDIVKANQGFGEHWCSLTKLVSFNLIMWNESQ